MALTVGVIAAIAASNLMILPEVQNQWGEDYRFFVQVAEHWQATGSLYLDHQLAGPYQAMTAVDVLYPPTALLLFVPFLYLPPVLWWAIPLTVIAWGVLRQRPPYWSWPLLAFLAWLPRHESIVIWGNTSMWVAAFVALGLRLAWPSVLILVKPTFLPFAVTGAHRRSWWIALASFAAVQLVFGSLWLDFLTATRNNIGSWPGLLYSVPDYLFVSIPLVAWLVGDRRRAAPD